MKVSPENTGEQNIVITDDMFWEAVEFIDFLEH